MDKLELKRRQLARLRGERVEPELLGGDLPSGDLNDLFEKPKREEPFDVEAWYTGQTQPSNETEPEPFIVGHRVGDYGELVALPAARWPSPGEPQSLEIAREQEAESGLRARANQALDDCIRRLAIKLFDPADWEGAYSSPSPSQQYAETWAWLTGIWQGRNIKPPSDAQMEEWAREYNATKRAWRGLHGQERPQESA